MVGTGEIFPSRSESFLSQSFPLGSVSEILGRRPPFSSVDFSDTALFVVVDLDAVRHPFQDFSL